MRRRWQMREMGFESQGLCTGGELVEQCAQGGGPFSNVRGWPENVDPVENFQVNGKFHACHRQVGGAPIINTQACLRRTRD